MKLQVLCILATASGADIHRDRREAVPLFGNVIGNVVNFKQGLLSLVGINGASDQKKKKPSSSYGAPSYNAKPVYNHHPAPSYNPPSPSYKPVLHHSVTHPVPVPHHAPAPHHSSHHSTSHHSTTHHAAPHHAAAPSTTYHAAKPEIHILPAPDLSAGPVHTVTHTVSAPDTYGSPVAPPAVTAPDTYGSPAAPAVSADDTYGSPVAPAVASPDTYGSPVAPAVSSGDTYGSPVAPAAPTFTGDTYSAPVAPVDTYAPVPAVYSPAPIEESVPVYSPNTYDPAPVDFTPKDNDVVPNIIHEPVIVQEPIVEIVEEPVVVVEEVPEVDPALAFEVKAVPDPAPAPVVPVVPESAPLEFNNDPITPILEIPVESPDLKDVVTVKDAAPSEGLSTVDVVILRDSDEEIRQPKAFASQQDISNQVQGNQLSAFEVAEVQKNQQQDLVIDLTNTEDEPIVEIVEVPAEVEEVVEELAEEILEEALEETVEEAVEEVAVESAVEAIEEAALEELVLEEVLEEAAEEVLEEAVEEVVEEALEEAVEEAVVEQAVKIDREPLPKVLIQFKPVQGTVGDTFVRIAPNADSATVAGKGVKIIELAPVSQVPILTTEGPEEVSTLNTDAEIVTDVIDLTNNEVAQLRIEPVPALGEILLDTTTPAPVTPIVSGEVLQDVINFDGGFPVEETTLNDVISPVVTQDSAEEIVEEENKDYDQSELSDLRLALDYPEENEFIEQEAIVPTTAVTDTETPTIPLVTEVVVDEEEEASRAPVIINFTQKPILRKVTFEIIDTDQGTEEIPAEPTTDPVEGVIPEEISGDPAFQEIAADSQDVDVRKRGFNAYDPRQSRVYAHKYNDAQSNWYYFRRGN